MCSSGPMSFFVYAFIYTTNRFSQFKTAPENYQSGQGYTTHTFTYNKSRQFKHKIRQGIKRGNASYRSSTLSTVQWSELQENSSRLR